MSKKTTLKPIAAALGTTFVVSMAASPMANAADNPFQLNELTSGYMVAEHGEGEGKCGEGKCGDKEGEGKCGDKEGEGKCGDKEESEGKCGEGKCGG